MAARSKLGLGDRDKEEEDEADPALERPTRRGKAQTPWTEARQREEQEWRDMGEKNIGKAMLSRMQRKAEDERDEEEDEEYPWDKKSQQKPPAPAAAAPRKS